jgi:ABC-type multidrug transport system fused ATPase/permease subunit
MSAGLPLAQPGDVRRWAIDRVRANVIQIGCNLTLFVLAMIAALVGPRLLGALVESIHNGTDSGRIDLIALAFIGALLVHAALAGAARAQAAILGERVLATTREGFVNRTVRLPLDVVEQTGSGDLLSRATSDVERLNASVRYALPQIVMGLFTIVLTVGAMLITSTLLTLVMLITVPLLIVGIRWYRRRAPQAYERLLRNWAAVRGSMNETVVGAVSVDALRLAQHRVAHNDCAVRRAERTRRRIINLQNVFLPCLELGVFLPMTAMLLLGGLAYRHNQIGLAALTAMVLYVERLADPLIDLISWLDELQMGNAALRRILGVERVPMNRDLGTVPPRSREVTVHAARFEYRANHTVLYDVELSIAPGEFVVLVGASGAGKSTLGMLIAGIYRPTAGVVRIGGTDVSELAAADLRRLVVMVTQETYIFAGTVRDNLTMTGPADEEWSDEALWAALRAVGAETWVRALENELDTPIGSGDVAASEAQLLTLARIVLADPQIVVLDEATAALDSSTTRQLESSLTAALRGRTVIAIAHELGMARTANRVAFMEQGRIVELGAHDELLSRGGRYADLWRSWVPIDSRTSEARVGSGFRRHEKCS